MSIDASKFEAQGKPTPEQARTVYDSLTHQTVDTLHEALTKKGYSIGRATVARWIRGHFIVRTKCGPVSDAESHGIAGVPPQIRAAEEAEAKPQLPAKVDDKPAEEQPSELEKERLALQGMSKIELQGLLERESLIANILLSRQMQRKADKLVLVPKDTGALVGSMTEATASVPAMVVPPAGHVLGDGARVVEASVVPPNPVSDAIALFKKRQGVAA